MFISNEKKAWTDAFENTAQRCTAILNSLLEEQESRGPSVRDAGLLIAQFTLSNTIYEDLPESETSSSDRKFVKKTLINTCSGLLDNRTNTYKQISADLGDIKFIDQIPLRLIRKILGIATGLPHKENDQFLSPLFKSLNSIHIPIKKIVMTTPPLPAQGEFGLGDLPAKSSTIPTRKARAKSKQSLGNVAA